ncbi:MAG: hypothetical protein ACRD1L_04440 [Terriglobales bacterium]
MVARIGDDTDDYCTRCHRMTNHSVAAMVGDAIASASCRTCAFQHPYRGGKPPARAAKPKPTAFDQVLAGIIGDQPGRPAAPPAKPRPRSRNK